MDRQGARATSGLGDALSQVHRWWRWHVALLTAGAAAWTVVGLAGIHHPEQAEIALPLVVAAGAILIYVAQSRDRRLVRRGVGFSELAIALLAADDVETAHRTVERFLRDVLSASATRFELAGHDAVESSTAPGVGAPASPVVTELQVPLDGASSLRADVTWPKPPDALALMLTRQAVELLASRCAQLDLLTRDREALRLWAAAMATIANPVFITDRDGRIQWVNEGFVRLSGYPVEEVLDRTPGFLGSGQHEPELFRELWSTILSGRVWHGEVVNRRKDGSLFTVQETITPLRGADDEITHFVAVHEDITARKAAEGRIRQMALYDFLTGLPNRALFERRLTEAMAGGDGGGHGVAVLFIDLDRFKTINDTLGHRVGDELLKAVGQRLRECTRERDTVARFGGDEFAVVLSDLQGADEAAAAATRILDAAAQPYQIAGREVFVTVSIGIALFPGDTTDAASALRDADVAMYRAKDLGRNRYQFHSADLSEAVSARFDLESDLRAALRDDELRLYYQPQVSLLTGKIVGIEALIRWQHPLLGLLAPHDFLPIAEETGLIVPMGEWVLREACRQNKDWQDAGVASVRMAVNLSARQLRQGDLLGTVERTLLETGMEPRFLEIEVTETVLLQDTQRAMEEFTHLKALGVGLAIDDFGTGYSSPAHARQLPIDRLKIDQSFVKPMPKSSRDTAIVRAIVMVGHELGFTIVAEGVETPEQAAALRALGCDEAQGYLYCHPLPADELTRFLVEHQRRKVA